MLSLTLTKSRVAVCCSFFLNTGCKLPSRQLRTSRKEIDLDNRWEGMGYWVLRPKGSSIAIAMSRGVSTPPAASPLPADVHSRGAGEPSLRLPPAPSPTLTCVRKGVCKAGKTFGTSEINEEAGKGPFQAPESPAVFIAGEVQIAARARGSTSSCRQYSAETASSSKVSPMGAGPK